MITVPAGWMQFGAMHDWWATGPFQWFAMSLGFAFWILVAVAVIAAIRYLWTRASPAGESALDILRKRYARGEITREEFQRMRQDLG